MSRDYGVNRVKRVKRSIQVVIKRPRARETYFPDAEMESVGSPECRSDFSDPGKHTPFKSELKALRRLLMAYEEVEINSRSFPQRIRFYVIDELISLKAEFRTKTSL